MNATTASDLYEQLCDARLVLDRLHADGRLSMSRDVSNTHWPDVDEAVSAALAGLDVATRALAWMETRTDQRGD